MNVFKPTKQDLVDSYGKRIPDLIAPDLKILFCGINPGLYSGATGRHFARPGNRFWKALYESGLTEKLLHPSEGEELLKSGLGITNFVNKTTALASELTNQEYQEGAKKLEEKVKKFKPKVLAVLGVGAYRTGFNKPQAKIGLQDETIGKTRLFVLPNPSGLNARFQSADFAKLFKQLNDFISKLQ